MTFTLKAAVVLTCCLPAVAYADQLSISTGANYITGKYGADQATDIVYIPFIAKYELANTSFKVTIPWVSIKGVGSVTSAGSAVTRVSTSNKVTTESGLGDVVAAITQSFTLFEDHPLYLDITGKVKFATASESKGLGTGKNDYTVLADVYKSINTALMVFGGVGYKVYGDPSWMNFNNVWSSNLGFSYNLNQKLSLGMMGDLRQASSESSEPLRELMAFSAYKFDQHYKVQAYLGQGDSDASADFSCGLILKKSF